MKSSQKGLKQIMRSGEKNIKHNIQVVVFDEIKSAHIEPTDKCIYILYKGYDKKWQRIKINRKRGS